MKALRVIVTAILIAAAATGIGFAVNTLRPQQQRLPLIRHKSVAPQMALEFAKDEFDRGVAVFVDARNPGEYEWEHIPGALNLPLDDAEAEYERLLGGVDKTRLIIVYCSSPSCETSAELADKLVAQYHHETVWILAEGFSGWRDAGYPVEQGAARGEPSRAAAGVTVPIMLIVLAALVVVLALATRGRARAGVATIARVLTGGLLVWAAYYKILEPNEFAKAVIAYQALDYPWTNLPAIVLPWVEMIAGVLLVVGAIARGSALVASALYLAFTALMVSAMQRGIVIDDCGCFGFAEPLSWLLVWRDIALLAMALVPVFVGGGVLAADALGRDARRRDRAPDQGQKS